MKPKYIRVASDLHLEQRFGKRAVFLHQTFLPPDERDTESVLVLAGDISSKPDQLIPFLREVEKHFPKVYYMPGNHEFYGHQMLKWAQDFRNTMASGPKKDPTCLKTEFATLGVSYEELENMRIIFGTLWADGGRSSYEQAMVARGLNDFHVIHTDDKKKFTVPDMILLHKQQKAEIKAHLAKPFDGITVVATHHMPSYRLCHPRFGNEINGGFASDCEDILTGENAPDIWIHGHTHDTGDNIMWNTRIVCNPSGYYFENDKRYNNFRPMFIDLENPLGKKC